MKDTGVDKLESGQVIFDSSESVDLGISVKIGEIPGSETPTGGEVSYDPVTGEISFYDGVQGIWKQLGGSGFLGIFEVTAETVGVVKVSGITNSILGTEMPAYSETTGDTFFIYEPEA